MLMSAVDAQRMSRRRWRSPAQMMGNPDGLEPGIVPLAVDTLFESILSRSDDTSFSLRLSVLEILEER